MPTVRRSPPPQLLFALAALLGVAALAVALLATSSGEGDEGSAAALDTAPARNPSDEAGAIPARDRAEVVRDALDAPQAGAPTHFVRGRLLGPDGVPAAGAAVWTRLPGPAATEAHAWDVVRGDGAFALPIPAREFVVHAAGRECGEAARSIATEGGDVDAGEIVLPAGGTLRGRVLDVAENGIEGLDVVATAQRGSVWETQAHGHPLAVGRRACTTDAEGRFELRGLRPVEHEVDFGLEHWNGRWEPGTALRATPGVDELVVRQLPDGVLRGRVLDAITGAPLRAFEVNGRAFDAADGRYAVSFAAERGVYASARGYLSEIVEPPPGDGEHDFSLEPLPPPPKGRLVVRAVDERGESVPMLRLRNAFGRSRRWVDSNSLDERALVRGQDDVTIVDLRDVSSCLCLDAPGHALALETLKLDRDGENRLEVVLPRGASVHVTVHDALGLVARDAVLEIDSAKRKERHFEWRSGSTRGGPLGLTDSAETFRVEEARGWLRGLPAGGYTLLVHVSADDVQGFAFDVDVSEARSHEFRLRAP